jgi:3-methyladenine DNA glycosylase AlkD
MDAYQFAELLLTEDRTLIHRAAGALLADAGRRDPEELQRFLDRHGDRLPPTMRVAVARY